MRRKIGKLNSHSLRWARNNPARAGLFSILAVVLSVLFYTPFSGLMASSLPLVIPTPPPPGTLTGEILAPPSIEIAEGSNVITAGVGLHGGTGLLEPGDIVFNVPQDASIEQVLLYWVAREGDPDSAVEPDDPPPDQTTIQVNGTDVTGDKFAEVLLEGPDDIVSAYRADITDMELVSQGDNILTISGEPFVNFLHDGAGIVVITDGDDEQTHIEIRDGVDAAFLESIADDQQVTVPQTFTFSAEDFDREANLTLFVSQVAERLSDSPDFPDPAQFRTSSVKVVVEGDAAELATCDELQGSDVQEFTNQLQSNAGLNWDVLTLPITIPAGADSLTVCIESGAPAPSPLPDPRFVGSAPAAFQWIAAILAVTDEEADDDTGDGDGDGGGDNDGDTGGGGGDNDGDTGGGGGDNDGDTGGGGGDSDDDDGGDDGDGDGDDGDGGDNGTATSTPTMTPQPTETPESGDTPEPTETPEADDTPEATETPEADGTPEATETPESDETPEPTETPVNGTSTAFMLYPRPG